MTETIDINLFFSIAISDMWFKQGPRKAAGVALEVNLRNTLFTDGEV